jgi:hypothetical protein
MLYSIARAAGLVALLSPSIVVALPSDSRAPRSLEVPWKKDGLLKRTYGDYPTGDGHTHGPGSRNYWSNGFDIDTDMDLKWPDTGKVVKVISFLPPSSFGSLTGLKYTFEITNTTLSPDGVPKSMLVVNGQYPGPVSTFAIIKYSILIFIRLLKQTGVIPLKSLLRAR